MSLPRTGTRTDRDRSDPRTSPEAPPGSRHVPSGGRHGPSWPRQAASLLARPVPAAIGTAVVLHLLWVWFVANSGGDLAAQDAWAEFARAHPGSAYNLAWYGGVHPVSYSAISPYVMATLGVHATMVLAGTLSAGLLALLLVRSHALERPVWPALYGAFALAENAVSGRVTYALGIMFGLGAVAVVFAWPERWRRGELTYRLPRAALAASLSALATAASPVAGLFVGVVATALWLGGRRLAAYALGLPPVAVVTLSAWLFPFSGQQPMAFISTILPILCGVCGVVLAPKSWRTVRIGSALYIVAVLLVWVVPSQVGSNITRLGLNFGGVLLVAIVTQWPPLRRPRPSDVFGRDPAWTLLALSLVTLSIWQVGTAVHDTVTTKPTAAWSAELGPLIHQLEARNADRSRVEVVPASSHREASALAPYVNLARGWNRQADTVQNPIFYDDDLLTSASYRAWLDRWAVQHVVLPAGEPDRAAVKEAELVAGGLDYLDEVWSDANWRLFEVRSPTPLADSPAVVTRFDATEVDLTLRSAGTVLVRIPYSPWLSLVDAQGEALQAPESIEPDVPPVNVFGCLSEQEQQGAADQPDDDWTVLHAPSPGVYRIAAPYKLPRGTACPEDVVD